MKVLEFFVALADSSPTAWVVRLPPLDSHLYPTAQEAEDGHTHWAGP